MHVNCGNISHKIGLALVFQAWSDVACSHELSNIKEISEYNCLSWGYHGPMVHPITPSNANPSVSSSMFIEATDSLACMLC